MSESSVRCSSHYTSGTLKTADTYIVGQTANKLTKWIWILGLAKKHNHPWRNGLKLLSGRAILFTTAISKPLTMKRTQGRRRPQTEK